jgi:Phage capsid family
VCPDWTGPGGEGSPYDAPAPEPDFGDRPAGMRPAGMRPAGMRPAGMRPAGMRPAGMRPAGMRPAGMRPAGMRPAGMRPAGMRDDDDMRDRLDPDEWSADIAELFCAYSVVIRSGARLVLGESDLIVPSASLRGVPEYLPPPVETDPDGAAPAALGAARRALGQAAVASSASLTTRRLRPRDNELTLTLEVRDQLVRALVEHPEIAWALKEDIARALALRADEAFLRGPEDARGPNGIATDRNELRPGGGPLETTRAMVAELRGDRRVHFGDAGWILDPSTLDALTNALTRNALDTDDNGTSLDSLASGQLLAHDGADGGVLLGYPFIVSTAAGGRIYFGSDWSEAWIGADPGLVSIQFSTDARFPTDETVLRAVAHHDLVVRRSEFFTHAPGPER